MALETSSPGARAALVCSGGVNPRAIAWLGLGALLVVAFHVAGGSHDGFAVAQGRGLQFLDPSELVFAGYYVVLGSAAALAWTLGLRRSALAEGAGGWLERALLAPERLASACAALAFAGSLALRRIVLRGQVITDDELTYDFIARTLLEGRVWNAPPIAPELLKNHYVIATEQAWYGKYPIGHPLLLALGDVLRLPDVIGPASCAASVLLTYALGRRVLDERRAALACVLLACSPHFVWTHATRLSQTTSTLCMLLGALGLVKLLEGGGLRFAALAGAAFGFGVLARPLPGCLFVVVALLAYVLEQPAGAFRQRPGLGRRARELVLAGAGVAAGLLALALVNAAQSGSPWTSGYQTIHAARPAPSEPWSMLVAASVSGALLRENLWLHGWPLSLALLPFARFARYRSLIWGLLAAELLYRVGVPKTVVATTGPIYTLEAVPLLCLATSAGLARLERSWARAAVLAATLIALALFVPVQLRTVSRAAAAREAVPELLQERGVAHALVFAAVFVAPASGTSWAYFPPNPSPALDDDVVFLRMQRGRDGYARMLRAWHERFADRRAYLLHLTGAGYVLDELPIAPGTPAPIDVQWAEPR